GSTIRDRVVGAEEGTVQTAGAGNVAAQPVPLASVKAINPKEKWTGAVVVGGFLARGNTNSESLNITLDATRRREDDRISFAGGYFFQRQESSDGQKETSIDNWFAQGKYDYFFTEKFYGYGLFRVERDRIADLDLRLAPSVGVGYQWIESERQNFSTEAGIGWVYEEYDPGGTDEHIAGRLAYHYDQTINDKVKFFHNFEYLPSLEDFGDYNLRADVGIRADLTARMFTEFKIEWLYDSTPAPGNSENDLRYILGVGWAF
ncbi:MAG: DUF481 domain-containing protein, partial [Tepidisphaeraceae bacterium]